MSEPLLSISEAAKRLRLSVVTVRAYADKGILPVVKLPSGHRRFRREDVERLRRDMGLDPTENGEAR
jgi:excisionase family DNA binding protein